MKRIVSVLLCLVCLPLLMSSSPLLSQDAKKEPPKVTKDKEEPIGIVGAVYFHRDGIVVITASASLKMTVPDNLKATVVLSADGTALHLSARQVTFQRREKFTDEFKRLVEVKQLREDEVIVEMHAGVRLLVLHQK